MRKIFEPRNEKDTLSLFKGVSILFLSAIFILALGLGGMYYIYLYKEKRSEDQAYRLTSIIQSCTEKSGLKTEYLAELMNLSLDTPVNIFHLNLNTLSQLLLQSPVIRSVEIKRSPPNSLFIQYELRSPKAYLADFKNTGLDQTNVLIPLQPFHTPKKLPEIYLGIGKVENETLYGKSIYDSRLDLAIEFIDCIGTEQLKRVDTSQAYSSSFGNREVIVVLETPSPHYLRFSNKNVRVEWERYKEIVQTLDLNGKTCIIDLRVDSIALVKTL